MLSRIKNIIEIIFLIVLLIVPVIINGQTRKERKAIEAQRKAVELVISNLKTHAENLNKESSSLAYQTYFVKQLEAIGCKPFKADNIVQPFKYDDGKQITGLTSLTVNEQPLQINIDYFPLAYSAEKTVSGTPSMALRESNVPWFTDVKDFFDARLQDTAINVDAAIIKEANKMAEKGATALFIYNSSARKDHIKFDNHNNIPPVSIPIVYITKDGYKKYFSDQSQALNIVLQVNYEMKVVSGSNIIAYLDNGASHTLAINSFYHSITNDTTAERNESEMNATFIELAKTIISFKNSNYLFNVFEGEGNGLYGMKNWLENSVNNSTNCLLETNPPSVVSINYLPAISRAYPTLISRLQTSNKIEGEERWKNMLNTTKLLGEFIKLYNGDEKVHYPKDSAFINQDLKYDLIVQQESITPLTKEIKPQEHTPIANKPLVITKVGLGIIPDNTITSEGLKIKGVTPNRLAAKLGLKAGDEILWIGSYKVTNMPNYLEALSHFSPGDQTTIKIKRGEETKELSVQF